MQYLLFQVCYTDEALEISPDRGKYHLSNLIGLLAPVFLTMGVCNNIAKTLTAR